MKDRIEDKIVEIEQFLEELSEIVPISLERYEKNFVIKAACERYAEKIIESLVDLAFLIIKHREFSSPESDLQAFDILFQNKIISSDLNDKLQDAKGMRNILIHEYGKVDDEIVFNSLKDELNKDSKEFINIIKQLIKR